MENEQEFCEELTALLFKYKLGIAGEPSIYFLENDDACRKCSIDNGSKLQFA
jgi:hypothetical protein